MDTTPVSSGSGTSAEAPVPIEALEYSPDRALERALSLREALEMALVADEPAGPVLDELFDLIQLARK
jgi:hypothetical protein